jgi:hypothetical protein
MEEIHHYKPRVQTPPIVTLERDRQDQLFTVLTQVIARAMTEADDYGEVIEKKDHYKGDHFVYHFSALPNLHVTYNEAEYILAQLVKDGKIAEIGSNKYKPTT